MAPRGPTSVSDSDESPLLAQATSSQSGAGGADHVAVDIPQPKSPPSRASAPRSPRQGILLNFHSVAANSRSSASSPHAAGGPLRGSQRLESGSLLPDDPSAASTASSSFARLMQWFTGRGGGAAAAPPASPMSQSSAPWPREPGPSGAVRVASAASVASDDGLDACKALASRSAPLLAAPGASHGCTELEPLDPSSTASLPAVARAASCASSNSEALCLICLEPLKSGNNEADVITNLGCHCSGPAAYRHRHCVLEWIRHKGDRMCEICKSEMSAVTLPPPPPYAIFDDIPEAPGPQFMAFVKLISNHGAHWFVYCLCVCLVFKVQFPVSAAIVLAVTVVVLHTLRCTFMVCTNYVAHRRVFHLRLDVETGEA